MLGNVLRTLPTWLGNFKLPLEIKSRQEVLCSFPVISRKRLSCGISFFSVT